MGFKLSDLKNLKKVEFNSQFSSLIKKGVIGLVIFLIVILLIFVVNLVVGSKVSNEQLENIMTRAAKNYVTNNKSEFEKEIFGESTIKVSKLVDSGYMKSIKKYKGKDTNCTGSVTVFNNNGNFSYSPKLVCGSTYKSENLTSVITGKEKITTKGNGLYYDEITNNYIYRGEYVNNFLTFAGQTWRILRIDNDGNIRLLQVEGTKYITWDNRYNNIYKKNSGINYFEGTENSRVKDSILDYYNDETNFSSVSKSVIVPKEYCVGSRDESSTDKTGSSECLTKSELMGAGLPYVSELLLISLDVNCVSTSSVACSNYNYLTQINSQFWTATPSAADSYQVFYSGGGNIFPTPARQTKTMNIVITINGNVNYSKGNGTLEDPYIVNVIG